MTRIAREASRYLGGLAGVRAAVPLRRGDLDEVLLAEERYELGAALPVLNLGVRHCLRREHVVAILKDREFRRPPSPTLYLVEEGEAPESERLRIDGGVFHVLGEELIPGDRELGEEAVQISDTFYLFPGRRSDSARPSRFLLPPVAFPELESRRWRERVGSVVSGSPSPLGDAALRRICGFPDDPSLATLLVGFEGAPGEPGGATPGLRGRAT